MPATPADDPASAALRRSASIGRPRGARASSSAPRRGPAADELLRAATVCTGSPAVPVNKDPTNTEIVVVNEGIAIDWPILNAETKNNWRHCAAYFVGYGVVEEHFTGSPTPKFTGVARADAEKGPYVIPTKNINCKEGRIKTPGATIVTLDDLDIGTHALNINCKAYDVSSNFFTDIIDALFKDLSSVGYSALTTIPALKIINTASTTIETVEKEIAELVKGLSSETEIGGLDTFVDIGDQYWFRTIAQQNWICYKFLEFERLREKKVVGTPPNQKMVVKSDRYLALWKLQLSAQNKIRPLILNTGGD